MSSRIAVFSVLVAAILVGGFFYLVHLKQSAFAPVSPRAEATARTRLTEASLEPASAPTQLVTLYFPSAAEGLLIPETRPLALAAKDTDRIRQIVLALIEGSREGRGAVLPPSTTIRAVFLTSDGTAFLDLSQDALTDFPPGIESESLAVYSIVDSLTANVPDVKRVKFLVQGQEVQTLDGHVDLTGYFVADPSLIAPSQ
jgi:spore germination protein GerM